jgi:hypothetical protein
MLSGALAAALVAVLLPRDSANKSSNGSLNSGRARRGTRWQQIICRGAASEAAVSQRRHQLWSATSSTSAARWLRQIKLWSLLRDTLAGASDNDNRKTTVWGAVRREFPVGSNVEQKKKIYTYLKCLQNISKPCPKSYRYRVYYEKYLC